MNKKALSLAICLAMALPTTSNALSLGDIESNSNLNQPFKGKINLLSTSVAEAKTLRIRVAPASVFNRVGIDRPAFLNSIRFRTTVENGRPVILVTSNQAINEPFLNFLLEVSWPNGQLLKEYTVLLDPPVLIRPDTAIASNTAGVRAEPRRVQGRITRPAVQQRRAVQQPRRVVRAAAPARRAPVRRAAPVRRVAAASQARNYRVRRGDTLSKVAKKLGYRGIQNDQMMMALFEKNRRAFSKRNINNLKAGALLTRPSLQEARAVTSRKAKSQVIAQAREWKKARAQQIAKTANNKTANAATPKQARLEVVGSKDSVKGDSSQGAASSNAVVAELNKKITLINESLTTRLKENEELKSRVSELESLLRKKNRLITLKSEQLAQLQGSMSDAVAPADATPPEEVTPVVSEPIIDMTPTSVESAEPVTTTEQPTEFVVRDEGTDIQQGIVNELNNQEGLIVREQPDPALITETEVTPPEIAEVDVTEQESPFAEPKEESFDIMGLLGSPAAMGIGGGSLLALLGGLWFMRRRNSKNDDYEEFSSIDIDTGMDETSFDDSSFENNGETVIDESNFVEHDEVQLEMGGDNSEAEESEQDDILQEADVYIVYGLHDQAESELKRAIEKDPDNLAFRAKLLENYKAAGDKDSFEAEAKAFMEVDVEGKDNYLAEISEWGNSLMPENKLFSGGTVAAAATGAGVAMVAGNALATEEKIESDDLEEFELGMDEQASDEDQIEGLIDDIAVDFEKNSLDDDLENFNLDEILSETDNLDVSETVDEFEAELEQGDTLEVALEDDFDLDINSDAIEVELEQDETVEATLDDDFDLDINSDEIESFAEESLEDVVLEDSSIDTMDLEIDFNPGEVDEGLVSLDAMELDSTPDVASLDIDFDMDDLEEGVATDNTMELDSDLDLDVANLNIDLDSEDMKKIMPEDNAYTASSSDESKVSHEENLLAEFDDNLSFLDLDNDSEVIEETQIETRLDLAKAYIDMGDIEGARSTLEEVIQGGNDEQKREAEELLHQTG